MLTLMKVGDKLYYDKINIDAYKCDHDNNQQIPDHNVHAEEENEVKVYTKNTKVDTKSTIDNPYRAFGFNWPYFSYGTNENMVFIYNAFNPNFV